MLHFTKKLSGGLTLHIKVLGKNDLSSIKDDSLDSYRQAVERFTAIPAKDQYYLQQVHGDRIYPINEIAPNHTPEGDGILTRSQQKALVIKTADCMPVFLWIEDIPLLVALHSGWRGTQKKITNRAVNLITQLSSSSISGYIGPCIRQQQYQIKEDVAQYFLHYPSKCLQKNADGYQLDLARVLKKDCPEVHFTDSKICTVNDANFYSYRGGDRGRNLNIAYLE